MQQGSFSLDAFDNVVLEGYTADETWNGFACPYFTFEQAQKVVEASNAAGKPAHYDSDADTFVFITDPSVSKNHPNYDRYFDRFDAVEIEGMKLYAIGAFSWTWWDESREGSLGIGEPVLSQ